MVDNLTFDGIDIDGEGEKILTLETHENYNTVIKNARIGNVVDEKGANLGAPEREPVDAGTVLDNVVFHDVRQVTDGVHSECVFSQTPGLVIRNSTFINCATMDVSINYGDYWGQEPYGNVTLENNVFHHSTAGSNWHYSSVMFSTGAWSGNRIVNNTFENQLNFNNVGPGPYTGVWANNIGVGWPCLPGVTYTGNVGDACSGTDTAVALGTTPPEGDCPWQGSPPPTPPACVFAPFGWVDQADDLHLLGSSPAVDAGSATHAPAADRDGRNRVGQPDAGAYEYHPPFVGRQSAGTVDDWSGDGELEAWPFTSSAITVTKFCGLAKATSTGVTSVDLAIYSDLNNRPETRLATARYTATPPSSAPFCVTIPATALPASGKVWLGWVPHGGNRLNFQGDSSGFYKAATGIFGTPPATWPNGGAAGAVDAIIWAE